MSQQGNASSGDQSSNLMWMMVLMCGVLIFTWWLKRQWFIIPIGYFRYYELVTLHHITVFTAKAIDIITFHYWHISNGVGIEHLSEQFAHINPKTVKFTEFANLNKEVGLWIRYPIMILLFIMASIAYFGHGNVRFRQFYTMKSLRQSEVENWPQIAPVVSLDLVKEDIDKGPWAMSMTPLDFGKKHEILFKQPKLDKMVWGLDEKAAGRIFSMQLGRQWQGVDRLSIHAKALLVIFLSYATKNREQARHFLSQISASSASGKLNFEGIEQAAQKFKNSNILKWVVKRHAYNNTVLATLLELARTDGVLASAEFLWLKPVDRRMWYMLNSIGRQTAVVEVSGTFAHWLAEKRMQRPLKTPVVKEAISAYRDILEGILFIDESELWHSNGA